MFARTHPTRNDEVCAVLKIAPDSTTHFGHCSKSALLPDAVFIENKNVFKVEFRPGLTRRPPIRTGKGRSGPTPEASLRMSKKMAGANGPNAKLTAEQVSEIRRQLADEVPINILATLYGVTRMTIYKIRTRKTWKEVV